MQDTDLIKLMMLQRLGEARYGHCLRTAETARELAERFGADPDKAYLAGLLHDCAKAYDGSRILLIAQSMGLNLTKAQEAQPDELLHGQAGAHVARTEYGVEDRDVLQAIYRHQCAAGDMTVLDNVVRLADATEPTRSGQRVDRMRELAQHSLEEALLDGLCTNLPILMEHRYYIEPEAANYYNALVAALADRA